MKTYLENCGEGRYQVSLQIADTEGGGLSGFLFGGEAPHVGGVALAAPRQNMQGDGLTDDSWLLTVPGHKDIYIAQKLARYLCLQTGQVIALTAGIHIEQAQRQEIDLLCENAMEAARLFVSRYSTEGSGK